MSATSRRDPRPGGRRWRDELIIALVLSALAFGVALSGWAWRPDRLLYDSALAFWRRPPPSDIVIVAIDDASIEAIGRWPWSRAVHATLLQRLASVPVRAIVLDLVLSEPDPDPRQDELLAAALRAGAPVLLPLSWRSGGWGGDAVTLEPVEPLRSAARLGAAEAPVDADGVLRHAFLRAGTGAELMPHLALAALQAAGEAPHPGLRAEAAPPTAAGTGARRDGRWLIRYAGPPGSFEQLSYVDLLSGAVDPATLAGRYVLIGMTAQGLGDTLATPVNARHHAMSGVEVLANSLATLKLGDAIREVPAERVAAMAGLALLALLFVFGRVGPRAALPVGLGSVPLAFAASWLSLSGGWWWSPLPYALPALLAYPLWSWRRLERAMVELDRQIDRLATAARQPVAAAGLARGGRRDEVDARLRTLRDATDLVHGARRFLADALSAMPTAMLVADETHRVQLANPQAAALFGADRAEDLHGMDMLALLARFSLQTEIEWPVAIDALRDGAGPVAVEAQLGADAPVVLHLATMRADDGWRLVLTVADIAPVKRAQRQREEVLAFVSHDLRAPANAIVMLADLHLAGTMDTPRDELLDEVRRLASRTLAMSEDFVRTAQAETGPLQRGPVRLQDLLDDALADHRAQAIAAQVTLAVALPEPERIVPVDRALVSRAVGNLVSNAIKHSPAGGQVDVTADVEGSVLRITVRDKGPGLTPSHRAQLARGDEGARVVDARGVGLGLLFVQRVARRHGGRLLAPEAAGGGALLELRLSLDGGTPS